MVVPMRSRAWPAWALLVAGCAAGALGARAESVESFVARHWRVPLAAQGPPPARFTPLEASLAPEACGTCHPAQLADWRTSSHAAAMGPGVAGQLAELLVREPAAALACQNCHAPLAEQMPLVPGTLADNPAFDAALDARGIPCAACHVRGHERFGPPRRDGSLASAAPRETLPHGGVTRTPAYLASEFCRSCHQFGPDGYALAGTRVERRIGREVTLDLEREVSDTRLAPGESAELVYARALEDGAVAARFSVVVYPDAFYSAFFEALLRQGAGRGENDVRRALGETRRSAFTVFEARVLPTGRLSPP